MLSPQQLFARLAELGIAQRTVEHPPVFTVEEAKALRGNLPGHHVKNLFLRNKKEEMWLVVALEDRAIDLKRLGEALGAGRLSFGSAERLQAPSRRRAGIGDAAGADQRREPHRAAGARSRPADDGGPVNVHPLVNTMTTAMAGPDLLRFFAATGHAPHWLDFPL